MNHITIIKKILEHSLVKYSKYIKQQGRYRNCRNVLTLMKVSRNFYDVCRKEFNNISRKILFTNINVPYNGHIRKLSIHNQNYLPYNLLNRIISLQLYNCTLSVIPPRVIDLYLYKVNLLCALTDTIKKIELCLTYINCELPSSVTHVKISSGDCHPNNISAITIHPAAKLKLVRLYHVKVRNNSALMAEKLHLQKCILDISAVTIVKKVTLIDQYMEKIFCADNGVVKKLHLENMICPIKIPRGINKLSLHYVRAKIPHGVKWLSLKILMSDGEILPVDNIPHSVETLILDDYTYGKNFIYYGNHTRCWGRETAHISADKYNLFQLTQQIGFKKLIVNEKCLYPI